MIHLRMRFLCSGPPFAALCCEQCPRLREDQRQRSTEGTPRYLFSDVRPCVRRGREAEAWPRYQHKTASEIEKRHSSFHGEPEGGATGATINLASDAGVDGGLRPRGISWKN